jgi:glutathione synthase/RimK-type ligase-like ATP-grasp enzyme
MILILSVKDDPHVRFIEGHLSRRAIPYMVLSPAEILEGLRVVAQVRQSRVQTLIYDADKGRWTDLEDVWSIWYRRPRDFSEAAADLDDDTKKFVIGEAQHTSRGLFANYTGLWVNDPMRTLLANYKLHQLAVARDVGFHIPDTLITTDPASARAFYEEHGGQLVHKTQSTPIFKIDDEYRVTYTTPIQPRHVPLLDMVANCPGLLQKRIPKSFEVRVTVFGDRFFSLRIDSQVDERTRDDWRRHQDPKAIPYTAWDLPEDVRSRCTELMSRLGLAYGAFDFIVSPEGEYVFLEVNPHGQWAWVEEFTGLPLAEALVDLLETGLPTGKRAPQSLSAARS